MQNGDTEKNSIQCKDRESFLFNEVLSFFLLLIHSNFPFFCALWPSVWPSGPPPHTLHTFFYSSYVSFLLCEIFFSHFFLLASTILHSLSQILILTSHQNVPRVKSKIPSDFVCFRKFTEQRSTV